MFIASREDDSILLLIEASGGRCGTDFFQNCTARIARDREEVLPVRRSFLFSFTHFEVAHILLFARLHNEGSEDAEDSGGLTVYLNEVPHARHQRDAEAAFLVRDDGLIGAETAEQVSEGSLLIATSSAHINPESRPSYRLTVFIHDSSAGRATRLELDYQQLFLLVAQIFQEVAQVLHFMEEGKWVSLPGKEFRYGEFRSIQGFDTVSVRAQSPDSDSRERMAIGTDYPHFPLRQLPLLERQVLYKLPVLLIRFE